MEWRSKKTGTKQLSESKVGWGDSSGFCMALFHHRNSLALKMSRLLTEKDKRGGKKARFLPPCLRRDRCNQALFPLKSLNTDRNQTLICLWAKKRLHSRRLRDDCSWKRKMEKHLGFRAPNIWCGSNVYHAALMLSSGKLGHCCRSLLQKHCAICVFKKSNWGKMSGKWDIKVFQVIYHNVQSKKRGHVFLSYLQRCWIQPTITALISKVGGNVLGGNSCRQIIKDSVSD